MAPPVSLCMIVKNEEANLPDCLGSAADLVSEIVVVDTGSTDRTKELAKGFGAKVPEFPWVDSFAAARNESVRHATQKWIFWLDADDRIDEANRAKLRDLFARLGDEKAAYMMQCLCKPSSGSGTAMLVDHARFSSIIPRSAGSTECTSRSRSLSKNRRRTSAYGRRDPPRGVSGSSSCDTARMSVICDSCNSTSPSSRTILSLYSIWAGRISTLGDRVEAIPLLRRSLELSPPQYSNLRKLYAPLMNSHYALGKKNEALAYCRHGRSLFPDDPELLFAEGRPTRRGGRFSQC